MIVKKELWKDIKGFEGCYQISSNGRIKSLERTVIHKGSPSKRKGRILKVRKDGKGYHQYGLYKDGKAFYLRAHRLVALHFIPNPENLPQVNHKDENKDNNKVSNLEWCTNLYNMQYSFAKEYTFVSPKGDVVTFVNLSKFCKENGLTDSLMCKVIKGKRNHHKGWTRWVK